MERVAVSTIKKQRLCFYRNSLKGAIVTSLNSKASPYEIKNWVNLSTSLDGRDKITKTLQYLMRILSWYYKGSRRSEPFRKLYTSLGSSRKAFRLGKFINELASLHELVGKNSLREDNKTCSSLTKALKALKIIGMAGHWIGDNVSYLSSVGFLRGYSAKKANEFASQCYFAAACLSFYLTFNDFFRAQRQLLLHKVKHDKKDEKNNFAVAPEENTLALQRCQIEQTSNALTIVKLVADIIVFGNNPGVDIFLKARGKKLHEALHCLFGLVSASAVIVNKFPGEQRLY